MNFGRYEDLSVHEILMMHRHRYLRWVYYNMSKISFDEQILDVLNIGPDRQIEKPGTDPELFESIKKEIAESLHGVKKFRSKAREDKIKRIRQYKAGLTDKNAYTKGKNRDMQQGKRPMY